MAAPVQLEALLKRTEGLERRAQFARAFGKSFACTLLTLPVAAVCTRLGGLSFLLTGGLTALLAAGVAWFLALRRLARFDPRTLRAAADARLGGHGVLLALGAAHASSRWQALVEESAHGLIAMDPGPRFPRPAGRCLQGSVAVLLLALLFAFWPVGEQAFSGSHESVAPNSENLTAPVPQSEHALPASPQPKGEFALTINPLKVLPGADALVTWAWTPRQKSLVPCLLHCVALVRDPEGTEDLGFGPGVRPLPLDVDLELGPDAQETGERHEDSLRRWLAGAGVQGGGSFVLCVLGVARRANGAEIEFRSPEVRVEVDALPVASAASPSMSAALEAVPSEAPAGKDKPRRGVGGDGREINLGDAEELGRARLVAKAVKPLLAGSATRRKEVEVFERAAGERAPRASPPRVSAPSERRPVLEVAARRGLRALHAADELRLIDEYFRTSAANGR